MSRETTFQVLNELHSHGLIVLRRGTIALCNRAALTVLRRAAKPTARVICRLQHADYRTELRTCGGLLHLFLLCFHPARVRLIMFNKVLQFLGEPSADSAHEKLHKRRYRAWGHCRGGVRRAAGNQPTGISRAFRSAAYARARRRWGGCLAHRPGLSRRYRVRHPSQELAVLD